MSPMPIQIYFLENLTCEMCGHFFSFGNPFPLHSVIYLLVLYVMSPRQKMCCMYIQVIGPSYIDFCKVVGSRDYRLSKVSNLSRSIGDYEAKILSFLNKKKPPFFLFLHLQGKIG